MLMLLHDLAGKAIALDQESVRHIEVQGQQVLVVLSDGRVIQVEEHFDRVAALVAGEGRKRD